MVPDEMQKPHLVGVAYVLHPEHLQFFGTAITHHKTLQPAKKQQMGMLCTCSRQILEALGDQKFRSFERVAGTFPFH